MKKYLILLLFFPSLLFASGIDKKDYYIQFKVGNSSLKDSHHTRAAISAEEPELDVVTKKDGNHNIYHIAVGYHPTNKTNIGIEFFQSLYALGNGLYVIKGGVLPTLASLPLGVLDGLTIPISGAEFGSKGFLLYGNYDFSYNFTNWQSYLGAGLGYATLDLRVNNSQGESLVDDSDSVFIYNVRFGANYPLNKQMLFGIEYNYLKAKEPNYMGSSSGLSFSSEFNTNSISTSLRWYF